MAKRNELENVFDDILPKSPVFNKVKNEDKQPAAVSKAKTVSDYKSKIKVSESVHEKDISDDTDTDSLSFLEIKKTEAKSVRKHFAMKPTTADKLKKVCKQYGISENEFINQLLEHTLSKI